MIGTDQLIIFTFVFLRISALLVMIPIIGERAVPLRVKGGLRYPDFFCSFLLL